MMQIQLPRERTEKIIGIFQYLSTMFPESIQDMVAVNKKATEGLTIEITPIKVSRSRPQENYYRKYCAEFGRFCGMTPDEMHEELLCECFGSTEHATKFGIKRRPAKRSSDLSREEYGQLVETLCRVAAEIGYYVPPAEEAR